MYRRGGPKRWLDTLCRAKLYDRDVPTSLTTFDIPVRPDAVVTTGNTNSDRFS